MSDKKSSKTSPIKHTLRKYVIASALSLTTSMFILTTPAWAEFSAQVNTQNVAVNDVLELTLTTDDSSQALPDLAPLEQNFQIISMSQSRLTHIVNGRTTQKYNWVITLSPKVVGQLTIPPLRLGGETSAPIIVNSVRAGQASIKNDESIKITAQVAEGNHYIFQEIPLTVRIETTQSVNDAELIMGDVPNLDIRQQGEDKTTQIMRDGQPVIVMERQYLLSPQKTGRIEIPPITVRGNFLEQRSTRGYGFDSFFDEQLREHLNQMGRTGSQFDSLFSGVGAEFVAKTDPVILDIQANPNGADAWFLPAKAVTLTGEWQPQSPTFKEGEAVTRKIELLALGAQPEQLPTLDIPDVDGLQIYIDSDTLDKVMTEKGVMAKRTVMLSIIPEHGGTFTLPELSIDWQNTQNDTTQTAVLPSEVFNVEGTTVVANNGTVSQPESTLDSSEENTALKNTQTKDSLSIWQIIGGLIAILMIGMVGWVLYRKFKQSQENQAPLNKDNVSSTTDSMLNSNSNNPSSTIQAEESLNAEQKLQATLKSQSIEQVYQALLTYKHTNAKRLNQQSLQQVNDLSQRLESALYGKGSSLHFEDVAASVNAILSAKNSMGKTNLHRSKNQGLPQLYPN